MLRKLLIFTFIITCSNLIAQVYQMDNVNGMTINTCSGTFYDSDALDLVPGSGDLYYDINENYQVTFCSSTPGDAIRFDFSFIQAVAGEDTLWVYDGTNTASTPIGIYSGGYGSQSVIGYSGCLTFVFQSTGAFVSTGWEASISCFNVPPTPLQPSCTNVGFESGNFNGWYGTYGTPTSVIPATGPTAMSTGAPGSLHPNYFPDVYGVTATPYHTITSGVGTDLYGGFPVVSPTGGTNSMMLGDFDNPYYGGSSIEQKFNVTAANAVMIYSYAVVIQNAFDVQGNPHLPTEQPYFQIEAFDCNGNSILCGDYLVVGGPNIPGFTLSPLGTDVYYKPWTDVFLDLTPFIGSCVTVKFTQGDCTLGAHFSYVYLDAVCTPLEITGPQYICPGEFATLVAPSGGASYLWSPGGEITPTITVSPSSLTNYSCTVTSVVGPTCVSTAFYWVDVYPPASVVSDSQMVCVGSSATLTATPNSAGGTFSWSPGGAITPSITVTPSTTTNYTVTFTDANGCVADSIGVVTVIPAPIVDPVPDETVCHNDVTSAVTFTSATAGATFAWTNSNTSIGLGASGNGNVASFTATNTGTSAITATITVTPTANGCVGLPVSYTITVNPIPIVAAVPDETVCSNDATTAVGFTSTTAGTTFAWTNDNTSISMPASGSGNIPSFTATNTGTSAITATITVTPTANGCVGLPISYTITVNPIPIVDPISDETVCHNDATTAVGFTSTTAGATFAWTNNNTSIGLGASGNGNVASFTATNTGTSAITATITVTPTANGCVGLPISYTITVNPIPIVAAVPDETVCSNDATTTVGFSSTTAGATFAWTNNNTSIGLGASGNGNVASFTAINTGTAAITAIITVTPTANGCVGLPVSYTITVNPTPSVNPILDQTICSGSSTTALNFSGSVVGTTYGWVNSNTSIGLVASGTGGIASFTGTNSGPGSISGTVTVTPSANGCFGAPTNAVITVNPLPTAIITGTVTICEGSNALITFAGFNGAAPYTFTYNINNGSTITTGGVGSTVNIIIPSPAVGTYIYNLVSVADGSTPSCSQPQSGTVTITVNPNPVPVITGTLAYCQGTYTTLSTINVYSSYLWSTGVITPTADVTIADNPITVQVTNAQGCIGTSTAVNVLENTVLIFNSSLDICQGDSVLIHGDYESISGIYTNTYVLPNGCDSILNVTLVVNPLPVIDAGLDQIECEGIPVTLNAVGASIIVWDVASVINGVPFTPGVGTVTYTATGTDLNGCSNFDSVDITIYPTPTVDPISDQIICHNETINAVNFNGTVAGTSFTWLNDLSSIGLGANGAGNIASFNGINNGPSSATATITVTPSANGCLGMPESFTITVNPVPVVNAGPDMIVCDGEQIVLSASGANTYVWDNNVTNGIPFDPVDGVYSVIGTDINGCIGADDMLVTIEPLPIPDFIVDVPICEPFTVTLTNTTQGNISECVWSISNGAVLTGCGPIIYTFDNSGSFDVTLTTTSASGCVGSTTYTDIIYLEDSPVASFNPGSSELSNFNTQIQFNNTSTGATNYFWTFGDQSPYSTEVNPLHLFPDDISGSVSYLVTLIAYSANGCPDTAYALITVNEELIFYVPNTFTPDNDDFNETFKPVFTAGFDPFDYTLLIFDRWGEIVFESHDTEIGWDATYANKYEAQDGTYTWKIDFKTTLTDERIMVHGHVNVLR